MTVRNDVAEAIDSARSVEIEKRRHSFAHVRAIVLAVVRELPADMTMRDLADELEISEHQGGEA